MKPRSKPARRPARHAIAAGTRQRGASLVEVLIGVVVITVGLLGTARWQAQLRQATDLARQQGEALRLARQDLERLRAWSGSDGPVPAESTAPPSASAAYTLTRRVSEEQGGWRRATVTVDWLDARLQPRQVRLDTALFSASPAHVLALTTVPAARDGWPRDDRHPAIPADAEPINPRQSVFKPVADGGDAWVFDHRSGRIVARCSAVPSATPTSALTPDDLGGCEPANDLLLSGRIRFQGEALGGPPNPVAPDALRPMRVSLQRTAPSGAGAPVCFGEPATWALRPGAAGPTAVVVGVSPAGLPPGWRPRDPAQPHWRYHCAVPVHRAAKASGAGATEDATWSGRLRVAVVATAAPAGGPTGVSGVRTVCRHSADLDGNGAIDQPGEAPDELRGVDTARVEQNFLVVDGGRPCPSLPAASTASGEVPWSHANIATRPHPP